MKAHLFFGFLLMCLFTHDVGHGQVLDRRFHGKVVDSAGRAIEFASIHYKEGNYSVSSMASGHFTIKLVDNAPKVSLRIAYVGKRTIEVSLSPATVPQIFVLQELSLTLDEVSVTPQFRQSEVSNSSITYNRQAIERVQAFSLMDVLNTLPGKATVAPNINAPQIITLRGGQGGLYDFNNSLGVSIILDGVVQSNDANMQSRSLSRWGMAGSIISSNGGYGAFDVPYQGIDLREIPVESIESVEVVQGVASAKYGELTDGAIIVERQAGRTPYQFTTNINGGSSSFALSRGYSLGSKWGALNVNLNYAHSNSNPRDKLQEYGRISQSMMWTRSFGSRIKNTFSFDYNRRSDDVKQDPDDDSQQKTYSKNEGIRLSSRLNADVGYEWLTKLNVIFSYSGSTQETYKQWLLNGAPRPYTNKDTTGIYEGYFLDGRYLAEEHILGAPKTFSANMNLNTDILHTGHITHNLSYGFSYSSSNNGGKGIASDPDRPRWVNNNSQNERPYSFESAPSLTNVGVYLEDNIKTTIAGKALSLAVGLRQDWQNGFGTFQPRINGRYELNKQWQVNVAYGISTKAPTLAHRYPSPTWLDIPLLQLLGTVDNQYLYLVYTEKTVPDNSHLKPSKSTQLEIGAQYSGKFIRSSLFAYAKQNRDGFSTVENFRQITLPQFGYTYSAEQGIDYFQTGNNITYIGYDDYQAVNSVTSDTYGIDWMLGTKKIAVIQTNFTYSASFIYSRYFNNSMRTRAVASPIEVDGETVWYGIYRPEEYNTTSLMTKLGSNTHIPKIGFIISLNADVFWLKNTKRPTDNSEPIAYVNSRMEYVPIESFSTSNPLYGNLSLLTSSETNQRQPIIYGIVNMSVAKEIRRNIRFSVTAYNVLNLHPEHYRIREDGTEEHFEYNSNVSLTGSISIKF